MNSSRLNWPNRLPRLLWFQTMSSLYLNCVRNCRITVYRRPTSSIRFISTVEQVQRIAGSDRGAQASVALWAFLHGAVALEAAQVLSEIKPASGLEFGFEAWLMAVSTRRVLIEAPRTKPTWKTANTKVSARKRSVRSGK
jgi:hypothetical protein